MDGSRPSVKLNQDYFSGFYEHGIDPDGHWVVYRIDSKLYSVPIDGMRSPVLIQVPPGTFHDVRSFQLAPRASRVVFRASQDSPAGVELFSVAIGGDQGSIQISSSSPSGPVVGDVEFFRATPDGSRVVYAADQDVDLLVDLFSVRTDGKGEPVRLTRSEERRVGKECRL